MTLHFNDDLESSESVSDSSETEESHPVTSEKSEPKYDESNESVDCESQFENP